MGKLEYTQGKWSYRQKRGNNIYEHQVLCDNRIVIAELDGEDFEIKGSNDLSKASEIKANAKLIAAAPDLFKILCEIENAAINLADAAPSDFKNQRDDLFADIHNAHLHAMEIINKLENE